MRRYHNEDDYWQIRDFLRRVLQLNGHRQFSWPVARLDYWRWHLIENCRNTIRTNGFWQGRRAPGGQGLVAPAGVDTIPGRSYAPGYQPWTDSS
jgi:hypothetical protein